MVIKLVSEYNDKGILMQFPGFPGAYTRGDTEHIAYGKARQELLEYAKWANIIIPQENIEIADRVKAKSDLQINDADSEILLDIDRQRLSESEFERWCKLVILSANCVKKLYDSITDKNWVQAEKLRCSFLGNPPSTAHEMFLHIDVVCWYYLSRIGIDENFDNGKLIENRMKCMDLLQNNYSAKVFRVFKIDGEYWTETKVLRRFIWHDRIHAKALYRHGIKMGMTQKKLENPFYFNYPLEY